MHGIVWAHLHRSAVLYLGIWNQLGILQSYRARQVGMTSIKTDDM